MQCDQRLLAAVEVDVDEQQAGFDARDVEREHAGRMDVEGPAAIHQRVPDVDRTIPRHPDLIAQIACVSRPRDLDGHSRDGSARHPEVFEVSDIGVGGRGEKPSRGRTLQRERGDLLRDVLDADVEANGVLGEPP